MALFARLLVLAVTLGALSFGVAGREKARDRALDYIRLTSPQEAVLRDRSDRVIWRDGNRLGKTFDLVAEAIHRARGSHPFKPTHRPPVNLLLISYSMEQMLPLMEMCWRFAPKHELSPKCGFDPGRGITGKPPRLVFETGPGRGSVIRFATHRQGATAIAGAEYQWIGMDEPTPEGLYGEAIPRLIRSRGDLMLTFTPVPDMPDQTWLRELVDKGQFSEHNYHIKQENCWIQGAPKPFLTDEEIAKYAESLLPVEREMRLRGAWEPLVTGRWLTQFERSSMVSSERPPENALVAVGVDHGAAAGKQAAVLIAVETGARPRVWYWDEVQSDGYTTPEQDAEAILKMLRRNGLEYGHVDEWIGDRPTGDNRFLVAKDNKALQRELARLLRVNVSETKRFRVPHKFWGSVTYGLRLMNGLFGAGRATVHPRCQRLIQSFETFAGDRRDPVKDILDAARYPTELLVPRTPSTGLHAMHF